MFAPVLRYFRRRQLKRAIRVGEAALADCKRVGSILGAFIVALDLAQLRNELRGLES